MQISESEKTQSLSTMIDRIDNREVLNIHDPEWIQFIQDYRVEIRAHSTKLELNEQIMNRYRYRIRDFLESKLANYSQGGEQIFRVVNRLGSDMDFTVELGAVYLPDRAYMHEIMLMFNTRKAKIRQTLGSDF